ncbi:hypothetical protein TYM08_P1366 [Marinicellulosiphila megalodicopiae]
MKSKYFYLFLLFSTLLIIPFNVPLFEFSHSNLVLYQYFASVIFCLLIGILIITIRILFIEFIHPKTKYSSRLT